MRFVVSGESVRPAHPLTASREFQQQLKVLFANSKRYWQSGLVSVGQKNNMWGLT